MDALLDVKIIEREPIKVMGTRQMAAPMGFEERYAGLYRKAFAKKLRVVGAPLAIYHGTHFDGQINDVEIALPVSGDAEGVKELPGGKYICAVHNGPYGTLPITYTLLGMWLAQNDYSVCGAPYDMYVRGGNDKILSPEQYVTEIYVPVATQETIDFDFGENFGKAADELLGLSPKSPGE